MAAGDHTVVGTMTANKIAVTDTVVVANLNADQVDGADKDTDGTLSGNSDASVPTEKAVKTYVDAHKNATTEGVHGSTVAGTANKLIHRDASGRAQVAAPSAGADIARKDTVDTHAALTAAGTHGSTTAATANRLVHRDAAGRAKVVAPAVASDIALKSTVTADIATHAALTAAGTHGSAVAATAYKLMHRDSAGRSKVAAPSAGEDAANKTYVDSGCTTIVRMTGSQTVAGVKTFTSKIVASGGIDIKILHVRDEKSLGTGGGANNGEVTWETRTLNTVKLNEITGASLSSNQITLPAGTYLCQAMVPGSSRISVAQLKNISDSTTTMLSTGNSATGASAYSLFINVKFTIAATKIFEIQQKFEASQYGNAKGLPHSLDTEVYTEVIIQKMG